MSIESYSDDELIIELQRRGVFINNPALVSTNFLDVGAFHAKMELPHFLDTKPHNMTNAEFHFRVKAMQEEITEFIEAHVRGDIAGQGDALVDLVYFALGTAHYIGVPFDDIWLEVQRANMAKRRWREGDPVKPRSTMNQFQFDVVKPEGWRAPDIHEVIARHVERYFN